MRWRLLFVLSPFLLGSACGGRSVRHGDGGEAGDDPDGTGASGPTTGGANGFTGGVGGSTGGTGVGAVGGTTGGTGTGAVGGAAGPPPVPEAFCESRGVVLAVGQSTEDPRLCETCICRPGGKLECERCDATCRVSSATLSVGQDIVMPDGCTRCVCTVGGMDCDGSTCAAPDPCSDLAAEYELAVGAARWCGREYGDYTCLSAQRADETIPCGCPVVVRGLDLITPIRNEYLNMGCPMPPVCDKPCQVPRAPYRCGEAGFCTGDI